MNPLLMNCRQYVEGKTLVIDCPSVGVAKLIVENHRHLTDIPSAIERIKLTLLGRDLYPSFPAQQSGVFNSVINANPQPSYQQILDEIESSEKPICLTEHNTHRCVYLNGRFTQDRIILPREEYCRNGLNFLYYWRDSMDDLEELLRQLRQTGRALDYRYKLRRPDGSLCWYVKDYFLIDFCGMLVRKSLSNDWGMISPPPEGEG